MSDSQVYIDITDFLSWKGNFTGIQRTLYCIVKELEKENKTIRLMVYAQDGFQVLEQDIESISRRGIKLKKQFYRQTREERLRNALNRYYSRTPLLVRMPTTPIVNVSAYATNSLLPIFRSTLHTVRAIRPRLGLRDLNLKMIQKTTYNLYGPTARITPSDTVLVLSCIWDSPEHLINLMRLIATHKPTFHCLIYDLIPIHFGFMFGGEMSELYAQYLFQVLTMANTVFPISQATANDLVQFARDTGIKDMAKLEVIRLGDAVAGNVTQDFDEKMRAEYNEPFAISVGTIEARKNHIQLYAAVKLAVEKGLVDQLPHIYIIGRAGWLAQEVSRFMELDRQVSSRITLLHHVSDEQLAWFYKNASFSIYTSQYEGWGLPVAESFVYATPCIVSGVSSMLEIAPELSKFVSPYDTRELLDAMLEYSNSSVVIKQRKKIAKTYKVTTWNETAQPILRVLKERGGSVLKRKTKSTDR